MKKFLLKIFKGLAIGLVTVVLVTVGIDAADHYDNFSDSLIGRLIINKPVGPCPSDMVFVSTENKGFCIDKYEASPGRDCPYQEVGSQAQTRANLNKGDCQPVSVPQVIPWRFISQSQAANACAKAGKRLPTGEEWYLACLGTPDLAKGWGRNSCHVNNNWEVQPGLTGTGADCVSAAGAYDMIGNVWEWVKGEASDGFYQDKKLPEPGYVKSVDIRGLPIATDINQADPNFNEDYFWIKDKGIRGMARGGYWGNQAEAGMYAVYLVSPPSFAGTGAGFRCVK